MVHNVFLEDTDFQKYLMKVCAQNTMEITL